ncbi:hypothetical protein, partial [Acinetobacter ursingii]|uniref:hypothetical protein n=1 Tax=Acinetobacter ursingii TaxID=108980 RepID=UPI000669290F
SIGKNPHKLFFYILNDLFLTSSVRNSTQYKSFNLNPKSQDLHRVSRRDAAYSIQFLKQRKPYFSKKYHQDVF